MRKLIIAALAFLISAPALAFDVPQIVGPVNDYAKLLSAQQVAQLNERLRAIEIDSKDGAQVVVLTVPSLADESIDKVRNDVFRAWKLGQAGKDNGVLLVIAPVERKIGIEVGYGLEPFLTDGRTKLITEEKIKPHLKKGSEDWFKAIDAGAQAIGAVVVAREKPASPERGSFSVWPILLLFGVLAAIAGLGSSMLATRRRLDDVKAERDQTASALRRRTNVAAAAAVGAGAGYAAASRPRPAAPKPVRRSEPSRSSSYADTASSFASSSGSSWSSSSDSGSSSSSYSGGGGDSGGGGSSSDF